MPIVSQIFAFTVAVAQLVRASDCGSEGRGFESPQPPLNFRRQTPTPRELIQNGRESPSRLFLFIRLCRNNLRVVPPGPKTLWLRERPESNLSRPSVSAPWGQNSPTL